MRALSLPGCACRAAFQFGVAARLAAAGERFALVAGASSGSICGALTVAGLAEQGPTIARSLMGSPVVSTRYLASERSLFGMRRIVRDALEQHLPERLLQGTEAELLVATTHAGRYARGLFARRHPSRICTDSRVIHSNRERRDLHDVIVASCYLPLLYSGLSRLDGEVHVDGAVADNTLLDALIARGATDITVITPFAGGAVARTMFSREAELIAPAEVRIRVLYPERPLTIGRFDFDPGRLEQALTMPHCERMVANGIASRRASA